MAFGKSSSGQQRTALDVYRDFGKLIDELVELKPSFQHVFDFLPREANVPQDVGYRIAQVVTQRRFGGAPFIAGPHITSRHRPTADEEYKQRFGT